jgi:hypothetical protein
MQPLVFSSGIVNSFSAVSPPTIRDSSFNLYLRRLQLQLLAVPLQNVANLQRISYIRQLYHVRDRLFTKYLYTFVVTAIVYPILTHWGWASGGWLNYGIQTNGFSVAYMVNRR